MKKLVLLFIVCAIILLSACSGVSDSDSIELLENLSNQTLDGVSELMPESPNALYVLSGENRDEAEYRMEGGRMIFPKGIITQLKGSISGTPESKLTISEHEIGSIVQILEKDANAGDGTGILTAPAHPPDWEEGYGIVYIFVETAITEENGIYLFFSKSDLVYGGSSHSSEIDFWVDSPELAQKLRDIVGFKTIDLKVLERAVSAKCTSIFNGNTLTLTEAELRQLIDGVQTAEKVMATNYPKAVSIEIFLDDGEVIHALFTGLGYNLIGVEAELYEMAEDSAKPLLDAFRENDMPLGANEVGEEEELIVASECKYIIHENYTDDSDRDDEFFLSYAGAANYDSFIRLGGEQRDHKNVTYEDGKIILAEGMVVNTTLNQLDEEKVLAIDSRDGVYEFINQLESSEVFERKISAINSDEINIVTLNTAGEYTLLLLSLGNGGFVNCRILSENKLDNAKNFQVESEQLYEMILNLIRESK